MVEEMSEVKKNGIIILGVAFGLVTGLFFTIHYINERKSERMEIKLSDEYVTDQDLLSKASYVYQVDSIKKEKSLTQSTVDFTIWNATVKENLDTAIEEPPKQIRILQTNLGDTDEFPDLQRNGSYILFLDNYEGPIGEDLYVICGVSLGMIKENQGSIEYNDFQNKTFQILKHEQGFEMKVEEIKQVIKENRNGFA